MSSYWDYLPKDIQEYIYKISTCGYYSEKVLKELTARPLRKIPCMVVENDWPSQTNAKNLCKVFCVIRELNLWDNLGVLRKLRWDPVVYGILYQISEHPLVKKSNISPFSFYWCLKDMQYIEEYGWEDYVLNTKIILGQ